MKQSLHLKLSQQLTLTPQLKQSLKLLQLPSLDLENEIQIALDNNPLLERVESETIENEQIQTVSLAQDNGIPQPIAESSDPGYEMERTDNLAPEQDLSANWDESFEPQRASQVVNHSGANDSEFTQFAVKQESLFEHVEWQVKMTSLSDKDQLIATTILHCLNDDGYVTAETEDIARLLPAGMEIEADEVNAVLSLIKTLDPLGVGARNLQERLLILLNSLNADAAALELAKQIVSHHLDLVGSHNLAKLKKSLGVSGDELSQSLALITSLNPVIAPQFSSDNENYVIPDVVVKKIGDTWLAQLNSENHSKLRVNDTYAELLHSSSKLDKEGNDYIQHNLNEAKNFIKGLMSRYDTLILVSQEIVKRQQRFFEEGETGMQPMVLHDIANALEMHESTISRATSGKYLHSPKGVFELKYFFSSAVSNTDGATSSSTAIRSLIRTMVEAESKAKPLSDNKIAKELEKQGHIVARRTVAKYRESMQIAPSSQRKSLVG
ncbi:RNA polymerase factor sigma-54 [Arenicella sp. 4NH20-0111]|uniref:RNA polymerase factor sigma-54 n=1 Tax=Arenicella sp. 4NH20-0111 TaxID=3127648 RepID=UPI00310568D2